MAYRISAELTFWFLVMVVILTIVIVGLSLTGQSSLQQSQKENGSAGSGNAPAITRHAVIRAFGQEKRELQIFQTLNQVYARLQEKTGFWSSLLTPLTYLIVNGTLLVIIWQGLYFNSRRFTQSRCSYCPYQLPLTDFGGIG